MASAKYREEFDEVGHTMGWPTDFLARYLVIPQPLSQEQIARIVDGNNRSPKKGVGILGRGISGGGDAYSPAAPSSRSPGHPPLLPEGAPVPTTARMITQELSNAVWGSTLTFLALLLFQVGFTNKLAVGLWTAAVFISFAIALLITRIKNGTTVPLLVWNFCILFAFQLTLTLSIVQCLVLEATGSRSFTIVALSMGTMFFSIDHHSLGSGSILSNARAGRRESAAQGAIGVGDWGQLSDNRPISFSKKWGWPLATGVTQALFYIAMGLVDALATCHFSSDEFNFSSLPQVAVIQLFQQIVPVMMIVGSMARVYQFTVEAEQQRKVSEEFAIRCLRAAIQRDVNGLVLATEEYDQNPPTVPSLRDDALHMVIFFLHTVASQPTLVAPLTPNAFSDSVRHIQRTASDLYIQNQKENNNATILFNTNNKTPLRELKVTHLNALHSSSAGTSDNENADAAAHQAGEHRTGSNGGFPQPLENQPDKFSNTASDARKQRASRIGSIHGNLGLGGFDPSSFNNSVSPTRPASGNTLPIGITSTKAYFVLFALPKLSAYMMSSQKSLSMAEMFLGEFAEVVHEVLDHWSGTCVTTGFNFVVGQFSNVACAVAATVEAQTKMQGHSAHHKDITLNINSSHRLLTLTVVGEMLYGRPSAATNWAFGYTAVERIFDSAIQAFATREVLPANLIATNLTGDINSAFEFKPSPIHMSLMVVQKAYETSGGDPVVPASLINELNEKDVELLDLPMIEAAIPKYRPTHTTTGGDSARGFGSLQKTKSLAHRPPSGRAQSSIGSKPRKGLPPQVLEVWSSIDIDGNGYLDLSEMEALIKKIGLPMSRIEIREFFKKIDVDNSGSLTQDEFEDAYYSTTLGGATVISSIRRAALAMSHSNEKEFISLVEKSWRKYDVDGSGKLDQVEVGRILKDLGMNHSTEEVKWMFDRMDKDKSGFVEFDEFMTLFSADASEFVAVRERIQAVGRVMTKTEAIYSTPDQATRDYRVWVLDLVNAWFTPFVFAYIWYTFCSTSYYITLGPDLAPVNLTQSIINILIDCVYATWCIAKFAYLPKESHGTVTFKHVWKHHIKTLECWVDFTTIIPADLLYFILGDGINGMLISYYRANKILCIYHLDERYKFLTAKFNPAVSRAANALMLFFVFCHILCCALIALTRAIGADTTSPLLGINGILTNEGILYLAPLYWAILTLSGQLSGASIPELDSHLFLLQAAVLVGLPLYTVVLGTIGNAVNVEDTYTRYLDKIDVLRSFFEYTRLSRDFENEILDYYKHLYTTTGTLDIAENPLEDLPTELSIPVVIAMGRDMLKAVPIFKDASANLEFVHELTIKLVPKVIEPLKVVMRKGEIGAEMYFITFGNFNIVIETGKVVFTLSRGNFFGEIALLHSGKRTATIVNSHRFGNVLMLVKDQFQEVARFFPDCLSQVYKAAEDRIKQTTQNEQKEKEAAEKAAREAKEKEKREKEEAEKEANKTEDASDLDIANKTSPRTGRETDAKSDGANAPVSVPMMDDDGDAENKKGRARRKSITAEADESPRGDRSNSSTSYTKPATPVANDPVKANLNNFQLNNIGYALAINPQVFASVPVLPDTTFDDETRPQRPTNRHGQRTAGEGSHHQQRGNSNSNSRRRNAAELIGSGRATVSDFDDDDDDFDETQSETASNFTEGSTRTHSTVMASDSSNSNNNNNNTSGAQHHHNRRSVVVTTPAMGHNSSNTMYTSPLSSGAQQLGSNSQQQQQQQIPSSSSTSCPSPPPSTAPHHAAAVHTRGPSAVTSNSGGGQQVNSGRHSLPDVPSQL